MSDLRELVELLRKEQEKPRSIAEELERARWTFTPRPSDRHYQRGWLDNVYLVLAGAVIGLILFGMLRAAGAQGVTLQGPNGEYLGNLNTNQFDPNSVSNPYGRYGNPLSADSINNPLGRYGNPLSADSVRNPYVVGPVGPPRPAR